MKGIYRNDISLFELYRFEYNRKIQDQVKVRVKFDARLNLTLKKKKKKKTTFKR